MFFLHQTRNFINRLFSPAGFALMRVEKRPWFRPEKMIAQVGQFKIQVPGISPIATHYATHPNYSSQLGRLTSLLKNKYPQLAVIDIGANVGDTACIIKSAADVPVLCIEGDALTFTFLEENLRQFQNTVAYNLFLGEKSETLGVNFEKGGWNTTIIPDKNSSGQKVKLVSLDDFLASQLKIDNYKLLKIDTEGFDCPILRGARNFIRRVQPVITFEYNRGNMDAIGERGLDTLFMLADLGYARIVFQDTWGKILCSTTLANRELIGDLHNYADAKRGGVCYYDLTVFPESEDELAVAFAEGERRICQ